MPGSAASRLRVVLVDDDESVLETTAAVLEDEFELVKCRDAFEALQVLDKREVDIVCTDLDMPFMDGIELLRRVAKRDRALGAVLVTGHADIRIDALERPDGSSLPVGLVRKPYKIDQLSGALHRAGSFARTQQALRGIGTPPGGAAPVAGIRRRKV